MPRSLVDNLRVVSRQVLLLVCLKAADVMVPESETGRGAGAGDLELVHDLLPQFPGAHLHRASADVHRLVEFAEVELFAADRRHFEVVVAQGSLELNEALLELVALP
jgi:hypothetical protein